MNLYFAYGSCMNSASLIESTPSARNPRKAILRDYALEFHYMSPKWRGGVATITRQVGSSIEGVLWNTDELISLDIREASPYFYYQTSIEIQVEGETISAITYILDESYHEYEQIPPSHSYMEVITEGAREHLSLNYIRQLEEQFRQHRSPLFSKLS